MFWIFCLGFYLPVLGQEAGAGNNYAVVIGIAKYKNSLPPLQFADKDAILFADYLRSKAGGNVPATNIKLLINENATIATIYDALNWLQINCTSRDKAYFYFSGHGDVETNNKFSLGYLLAYNSPPNNYRNNAISIENLNRVANHLSAKNKATVVLVTDACHSGKLAGDYYKGQELVASQLKLILNNEVRLAACGVDEKAAEGEDWGGGRGIFSYYLLKGLNGLADLNKNDTIQLRELKTYLSSSFEADKILIKNAYKQHPALDGNPYQPMAVLDSLSKNSIVEKVPVQEQESSLITLLNTFKPLTIQPVDYFFEIMKTKAVENILSFSEYKDVQKDSLPLFIVKDCIGYQIELNRQKDSLGISNFDEKAQLYSFADIDTLLLLKDQLLKSRAIVNNFNEKFIQLVQGEAQDMINAYLDGDIAELEKRQYYYAGNRKYGNFLAMLRLVLNIAPKEHYLFPLLSVQEAYISGLTSRLEMLTTTNLATLMADAFRYQQKAMKLEPYAAYIHNEIGNLYVRSSNFPKAGYHFDIAKQLAPTWAIPWSNEIRLGLAGKNLKKALLAIKIADSLQHEMPYILMNAGLVMEQTGDLLTAESYFQKAISKNNVHFLPYERLGNLYIRTGEFEKADWALAAAYMRKKSFTVNDKSFVYGNELGGPSLGSAWNPSGCDLSGLRGSLALEPYILLAMAYEMVSVKPDSAVQIMKSLSGQIDNLPLLDHYMGKALFEQKKWKEAEPWLVRSKKVYQSDSTAGITLTEFLARKNIKDSCLISNFNHFSYDYPEDLYLLGGVYEKLGMPDKAIENYALIMAIENKRQEDQAIFKLRDYEVSDTGNLATLKSMFLTGDYAFRDDLENRYEAPIPMAGYIKLGRTYEGSGNYLQAEKVFLRQVEQNRAAAKARSERISHLNYYAVMINRIAEEETFDFYQRMLRLFSRDTDWQEKAGMFLYDRLSLIFQKVPSDRYVAAYKSVNKYAYPFFLADETGTLEESQTEKLAISATNETIIIQTPKYDPLKIAHENLNLSVQLSGDLQPKARTLEAIADLNSWMGNQQAAFENYKKLILLQMPDVKLRTKIIDYCMTINELPFAMNQLEILNRLGQATIRQNIQLANCYARSGLAGKALLILAKTHPVNESQKVAVAKAYAETNLLSEKYAKALAYLQIPDGHNPDTADPDTLAFIAARYYSVARINALLKQNDKAFAALKRALEYGFSFAYVLDTDQAWKSIRSSTRWKKLKKEYSEQLKSIDYQQENLPDWYPVMDYKMPY